jgi:hypothetical protein
MLRCVNIAVSTASILDVAKFSALTLLSLLILSGLLFPIAGLIISSLFALALKSPNRISLCPLGEAIEHSCNSFQKSGGRVVVKALCYKPEGRGFDTR